MGAAQWVFFTVMGAVTVHHGVDTGAADSAFNGLEAVDMAIAGAQVAIGQALIRLFGSRTQLLIFQ